MSYRAAIILTKNKTIAMIERHRSGQHYYTFPGGHVEPGETPEQAAIRETMEELGLEVALRKLAIKMIWKGQWQYYFLAEATGGDFGSGTGDELRGADPEKGTYKPVWVPVSKLNDPDMRPPEVAELVFHYLEEGWPEEPVVISG